MDWQEPAALAVVALTMIIMIATRVRRKRRGTGRACAKGCACAGLAKPDARSYLEPSTHHVENEQ